MKKTLTEDQVVARIRAECDRLGAQKYYAEKCGVSTAFLNDVLQGRRYPTEPVIAPLGIKRVVVYTEGK